MSGSEIVAVPIPQKASGPRLVSRDEPPRPDTSLEAPGKLPPVFREGGTVTAGYSSGITEGAAAGLMTCARNALERGLRPLVRIVVTSAAVGRERMRVLARVTAAR